MKNIITTLVTNTYEKHNVKNREIINEWTEHSPDSEVCLYKTTDGQIHKICEWRFWSENDVVYIAYNQDGSVNHKNVYSQTWEEWNRIHNKHCN